MREIEFDCYLGDDGLAYSNDRTCMGRASHFPIKGIYVHPKTGLIREQSSARIRWRRRRH